MRINHKAVTAVACAAALAAGGGVAYADSCPGMGGPGSTTTTGTTTGTTTTGTTTTSTTTASTRHSRRHRARHATRR